MDQLSESCNNFLSYPTNLIKYDELEHNLSAYLARLIELGRPGRTLSNEDASTLDILDLDVTLPTFRASCLRCLEDLKDQLKKSFSNSNGDPICRFV
jgi:hypothetical protein